MPHDHPYLFIVQTDVAAEHETAFNHLYDTVHVPALAAVDGVGPCQRYRLETSSAPGTRRYLALYHLRDPSVLESPAWKTAADSGSWKEKGRPLMQNTIHALHRAIPEG